MRGFVVALTLLIAIVATKAEPLPWPGDRIWFTPGPGTIDMLRLFEAPDEWTQARQTIKVFKFYQGQTMTAGTPGDGPNRYDAFVRVDAFRKLLRWGIRIAIEAGAVKEQFCTDDESGMKASVDATLESIRNVHAGGGIVTYVAMDEPFTGGRARRCGGGAFPPTADRLAVYIPAVRRAIPGIRIGLIEPYPVFTPAQFAEMLRLLQDRGITVDFLHIDAWQSDASPAREAYGRDMIQLADLAAQYRIPFGVIIWGADGDADATYGTYALRNASALAHTFRSWDVMPDHLIIQSWALSSTGQYITPSNLPEATNYTHTWLVNQIYQMLRNARSPRRS
jgi:hypothetical protein